MQIDELKSKAEQALLRDTCNSKCLECAGDQFSKSLAEGVLELIHRLEKSEKDLGDLSGAHLAKEWKEGLYKKDITELIEKLAIAVAALENFSDPKNWKHKEPDAVTQLGCIIHHANEALKKILGEADES